LQGWASAPPLLQITLRFINRLLFQFIDSPMNGIQGFFQVIGLIAQRRKFCAAINRTRGSGSRWNPSISPANAPAPSPATAESATKSPAITVTADKSSGVLGGSGIAKASSAAGHRTGTHGTASIKSGHLNHLL
jgi:hypothetical protein